MKHIAIFVPSIKSGGAEKQAVLLARCLSVHYVVHFIVYHGEMAPFEPNVKILSECQHYTLLNLCGGHWNRIKQLYRILRDNKVECIFNYLTFCDVVGAAIGRLAGVNWIYNGIRNSRLPKGKLFAERFFHNFFVTATIFNCYSGSEFFQDHGFSNKKCLVIPNGFPGIQNPVKRNLSDIPRIITVGRFVQQKDYETAIRAISLLNNHLFRFLIVGYGDLEQDVRKWVKQYHLEDVTTIYINPSNTQELIKSADIYLSTSLFEGTSNSIMEAMNWSLPVVATNVGDNSYLVQEGQSGYLTSIGDAEGIANSLRELLDDSELRNRMGERGNQILRELYSMELFEKRYVELIER
jgi:glycosyltransferase involved in cell wall biosynthesis